MTRDRKRTADGKYDNERKSSTSGLDGTLVPAETRTIDGSFGPVSVQMGVLDDDARLLLKQGQCLVMAEAVSRRFGGAPIVVREMDTDEGTIPIHIYVKTPDGALWDVDGPHDNHPDVLDLDPSEHLTEYDPASADWAATDYWEHLPEQHFDFANSVADEVLAEHQCGRCGGCGVYGTQDGVFTCDECEHQMQQQWAAENAWYRDNLD